MIEYDKQHISTLIPQRPPIVMVDYLCVCDADSVQAKTALCIEPTNWFAAGDIMTEGGIVEHMAQSAAALIGVGESSPRIGYIGEVKNMTIHRLPKVSETLHTDITIVAKVDEVSIVEAQTTADDQPVAEAQIKVFLTEQTL